MKHDSKRSDARRHQKEKNASHDIALHEAVCGKRRHQDAGNTADGRKDKKVSHAHIRQRHQVGKDVFGKPRNEKQHENHYIKLVGPLEIFQLSHPLLGNHGTHERRAELMDDKKDKRARNDAPYKHHRGTAPWAIHHARGDLHYLARNKGNHDLQKLHAQKDQNASWSCVANVLDNPLHTAWLSKLQDKRGNGHAYHGHQNEKRNQAAEFEKVGLGETRKRRTVGHGLFEPFFKFPETLFLPFYEAFLSLFDSLHF